MAQYYSDESREHETWSLPDVEVFYVEIGWDDKIDQPDVSCDEPGWYYWYCLPGCMPDSDPFGPYDTEEAALDAARED